jgi:phage shock protein PspC (stress-responsive transcriptional regulator)
MEPAEPSRKLSRSTTDKYVWGVAGGIGRQFGIDPMLVRVAFMVSVVFGGIGIAAYLALGAFLPREDGSPPWISDKPRVTTVAIVVGLCIAGFSALKPPTFLVGPGLIVVAGFTLLGVGLYRAFGGRQGEDPARVAARITLVGLCLVAAFAVSVGVGFVAAIGGGVAVAIISIAGGLGLIAAGLLGGPRWLILPAMVLVLPLAVVSAANLDLRGGVGHAEYRPVSVSELRPEYRLGMGQMDVDLRSLQLPAGETPLKLRVGFGEARLRVPKGVCVATDARVGVGAVDAPTRLDDGTDVQVDLTAPKNSRKTLKVTANVGVGHLQIDREAACA